jgi:hypothetical protein
MKNNHPVRSWYSSLAYRCRKSTIVQPYIKGSWQDWPQNLGGSEFSYSTDETAVSHPRRITGFAYGILNIRGLVGIRVISGHSDHRPEK